MRPRLAALSLAVTLIARAAHAEGDGREGALDVTAAQPGTILIDGAEYGASPQLVEHLPPGPHKVTLQFDAGGESTRAIAVRPGTTTPVFMDLSAATKAYEARRAFHFAVGVEGVISYSPEERSAGVRPGVRAFARFAYGVAPSLSLRADLTIGYLAGQGLNGSLDYETACASTGQSYEYCEIYPRDLSASTVPITTRLEAQVHFGSVYSMVFGADAGISVTTINGGGTRRWYDSDAGRSEAPMTVSQTNVIPMLGLHASFLTFAFGAERQFSVAFTQGLMAYIPTGKQDTTLTFEQTASFGYRF